MAKMVITKGKKWGTQGRSRRELSLIILRVPASPRPRVSLISLISLIPPPYGDAGVAFPVGLHAGDGRLH
jgi:hypothetical protein